MTTEDIELTIKFITALAPCVWPITLIAIVIMFRSSINAAFERLREFKLLGGEGKLDPAIQNLHRSVQEAQADTSPQVDPANQTPPDEAVRQSQESEETDRDIQTILDDSRTNPEVALIRLSEILEREVRHLFFTSVTSDQVKSLSSNEYKNIPDALRFLVETRQISKSLADAVQQFIEIRKATIHKALVSDHNILSAIDSGITLLKALRSIPHSVFVVKAVVDVYEDPECTKKRDNAEGLMIEARVQPGRVKVEVVVPTWPAHRNHSGQRVDGNRAGQRVQWQLSHDRQLVEESWYIDPTFNERKLAWTGEAPRFNGLVLEEIFGKEYTIMM